MSDNVIYEQKTKDEDIIYSELVAIYLETPSDIYVSKEVWERVNSLLESLSKLNPRYSSFYLSSENAAHSIPSVTFKQKLRSAIAVMGSEFGLEDLTDIIKNNRQDNGLSVNNSAISNPIQNNTQNVETKIEQNLAFIVTEIEKNLTDDQIEAVKPLIDDYKKKPTRSATEKLIGGILGLGKDIAVGILSNIISKQVGF